MNLDQLAEDRAADLRSQLDAITVPEPGRVVRRARHRRMGWTATAGVVAAVIVAAFTVTGDHSSRHVQVATPASGSWREVGAAAAGLDAVTLHALARTDDSLVVTGERPGGRGVVVTTWWSTDGVQWTESQHPDEHDTITAIASHDGTTLAIGAPGGDDAFVWRSTDGGRTWAGVASGPMFGVHETDNRPGPFVDGLTWFDGWWVAWGGAASGYEGIWTSRDGGEWQLALDSHTSGSIDDVARTNDGALVAYGLAVDTPVQWRTSDPTYWGAPTAIDLPDGYYVSAVNDDGTVALATRYERHAQPTLLMRSTDGLHWVADHTFPKDALGNDVTSAHGLDIAIGSPTTMDRPQAWVGNGNGTWSTLPESADPASFPTTSVPALPPNGSLTTVASIGERIVAMSGRHFDRYYVYDLTR